MMRRIATAFFVAVSFMAALPANAAEPAVYEVVKEKSMLKFIALQNSAPVEGRFQDFSADILFSPDALDKSHINAEVVTGSVQVANEDVQQNVVLPEWLSSKAFPKAVFTSKTIKRTPMTDSYYVDGTIEIRGKKAPATMNFELQDLGEVAIAKGYITLNRSDFGVGQGEWATFDVIKDEVRVEFRIFTKKSG